VTGEHLGFSTSGTSVHPDALCRKGKANCVGYAAFFDAILRYSSARSGIEVRTAPVAGKLYFLGFDMHEWIDDPFFRDHDFNRVEDLTTGKTTYVDPSLYDYTGIIYLHHRK
jgi:hypothetical protein